MKAKKTLIVALVLGVILMPGLLVVKVPLASAAPAIIGGQVSATLDGQVQIYVGSQIIGNPDEYVCAGTLIDVKWVLTAKHCVTETGGTLDNMGILAGDRRLGQGQSHVLESIHLNPTSADVALLELEDPVTQPNLVVGYGLGVPAVGQNVSVRAWGAGTPTLQVATLRVSDTHWPGATEENRLLLDDIGQGQPEGGDSGAGVYLQGLIYGVVSTVDEDVGETSAVPTEDIANWIQQVSGVGSSSFNPAKIRLMPLGDSITAGFQSSSNNGYRGPLYNELNSDGVAGEDFVGSQRDGNMSDPDNEGHSGYRIDEVAALTTQALNTYRPNVVTLELGTNDLHQNYQVDTAPQRLGSLIDQILSAEPDATVVVASLGPSSDPAMESRVEAYNAQIPELVSSRQNKGEHVLFADMGALTAQDMADPLHPNDAGYQLMADVFNDSLLEAMTTNWIHDPVSTSSGCNDTPGRWLDQGVIASGVGAPGSEIQFADINGDGRADYLVVDSNTGAVTAWLNGGPNSQAPNGWIWYPQNVIASGVGAPGSEIHFADINGDGRADYLVLDPNTGAVTAWLNGGANPQAANGWVWYPQGVIATGVGADPRATYTVFGDIDGDGRADYLVVNLTTGAVTAWLNGGANPQAANGWVWYPQNEVASGVGADGLITTVQFANVNCDPRADYLSVNLNTGAISAWTSGGGQPSNWLWYPKGQIASGVGVAFDAETNHLQMADLSGDGRADYLVVAVDGSVHMWQNNGGDPSS